MLRSWSDWPINDCGELLKRVPDSLYCLEPHPYLSLGAPYGSNSDPWRLRESVLVRLGEAQKLLQTDYPQLRFGIYDAWRPIAVQAFMVDFTIKKECRLKGVDLNDEFDLFELKKITEEVQKFWAPPSIDRSNPPPHSTGGAIDLTIIDLQSHQLDMGGVIDQIGEISYPNYYSSFSINHPNSNEYLWNQRRNLLSSVMEKVGFSQHPNEWWHFSYGDQLWAWKNAYATAIYGSCDPADNNEMIC